MYYRQFYNINLKTKSEIIIMIIMSTGVMIAKWREEWAEGVF